MPPTYLAGLAARDKALTHLVVHKSQAGRDLCPLKKLQSLESS